MIDMSDDDGLQSTLGQIGSGAGWTISSMLADLANAVADAYRENLSGEMPSTADDPLPVGIVTGELLDGVSVVGEGEEQTVINPVDHAGYIEYGTHNKDGSVKIVPRLPLSAAIDTVTQDMQDRLNGAMDIIVGGA